MYKLIIQDDEGKTTVVPLIRDEITIGRKEGNTIRLTERNVSRKHARIVKANGSVVVEDLDSYNGVKVNGTRIQGRMSVNESDRIQIGDYLLELKVDRGAQDATGTPPEGTTSVPPQMAQAAPAPGANGGAAAAAGGRSLKPTLPMAPATNAVYDSSPPSPPASVAVEQPGRLVVVSANFGGREFLLDKPALVIGRTDDNDVVINHRSISRHHAKIVIEQGRYCIVDMQSSNGVRVNGEEYGKVELRRGDMVDLGHVRLRYVEPGEDFVFDRDVQLVEVAPRPTKGRGVLLGGLGVVVVAAAVVLFLVVRGGGPKGAAAPPPDVPPKVAAAEPPAPAPTVAPAPAAVPPPPQPASAPVVEPQPTPAPSPKEDAAKLVQESKGHLAAERWLYAYAAAEKALAADPDSEEAKKLEEQAHAEFANEQTYQRFTEARDAGRVADAVKASAQIPRTSVYYDKAEADVAAMRDKYLKDREAQARALAAKGQCDKILALARQSGDVFPEAKTAVEKAGARCAAAAPAETAATPPTAAAPAAMTDEDAQKLIEEGRQAALTSNWPEARRKAEQVLKVRPDDQDALSIAGVSSCNLKDKDRAARYMKRLKSMRQLSMQQICAQQSIFFDE
jgi:pSer/pThr/pTyr-binding forkhead associated (FHA) protein